MYKLKATSAAFEVVDGPFAGRKYLHGQKYAEIPTQEKDRFEKVGATTRSPSTVHSSPLPSKRRNTYNSQRTMTDNE